MNTKAEIQCGSPEIPMNVERLRKGETMNNEVEIVCGSPEIPMNVEPEKGETMNNEVENHGGLTEETPKNEESKKGWIQKVLERAESMLLSHADKNQWLKQMRGNLSLIATVIATMTFQIALNPPGGIMSINDDTNSSGSNNANANPPSSSNIPPYCKVITSDTYLCPGEAVLAVMSPGRYFRFLVSNSICFVASISVCLLLASGISLSHRFAMWMLSIGMCITLTSLAVSYIIAVFMTTPLLIYKFYSFLRVLLIASIGLLAIIGLWHTLRLVTWGVKIFRKRGKKAKVQKTTIEMPAVS